MKIKDVMTRNPITVDKDERLETVLDVMRKHRISKLPVVEQGRIVGIISDGEIADELGAIKNKGIATSALHASSAMRRQFPTTHADADVEDAIEVFQKTDVGMIPVVHDHTAIGVVTLADFLPLVKDARPIHEFMVTRLHAVEPTDRVIHARRVMLDHGVERLPVLTGGKLVGIVGESDIAFGLARFRKQFSDNHQAEQLKRFLVEEIMIRNVVTGAPDTAAAEAARVMREMDIGALPVLGGNEKIAGMITRSDLVKLIRV